MPYFSDEDLPPSVKNNLPKYAREIYRKAFNHAWDSHRDPSTLEKNISRVELAAKIAWAAVKDEYVKKKKKWVKKRWKCDISKLQIIDISWPLKPSITEYDYRKIVAFEPLEKETVITMVNHTATHIDGPRYFFKNSPSVDEFPLKQLLGVCHVLDVTHIKTKITARTLKSLVIPHESIVLLKTRNSQLADNDPFSNSFIYLDTSAAQYLADKNIKALGIDYIALEKTSGFPSHKVLLSKHILIIEGLRLKGVKPGRYQLICLPLKTIGLDAAPARAILLKEEGR